METGCSRVAGAKFIQNLNLHPQLYSPIATLHENWVPKQTLNSKGWELSCPLNFTGGLPESLTQGLLIGKLLIGGLGVQFSRPSSSGSPASPQLCGGNSCAVLPTNTIDTHDNDNDNDKEHENHDTIIIIMIMKLIVYYLVCPRPLPPHPPSWRA